MACCGASTGCEEDLSFGCAFCGPRGETPPDPYCVKYHKKTGKCLKYAEGFTPGPEASCFNGIREEFKVTFPPASVFPTGGEGAGFAPSGGPGIWVNIGGTNTQPEGYDYELDTLGGSEDATGVRDAFAVALNAIGFLTTNIGDDGLHVIRGTSGNVFDAFSLECTIYDIVDGVAGSISDPCSVPKVSYTPYDEEFYDSEFYSDALTTADWNADYVSCLALAELAYNSATAGCAGGNGCACGAHAASIARFSAEWDCRIASVNTWMAKIKDNHDIKAGCCGGPYAECKRVSENAYIDELLLVEGLHIGQLRDLMMEWYDGFCTGLPGDDFPLTYTPVPIDTQLAYREDHLPIRVLATRDSLLERREADADCKYAEMVRRKACPAQQIQCEGYGHGKFEYDVNNCRATRAACTDGIEACSTAYNNCYVQSAVDFITKVAKCCQNENRIATNNYAKELCRISKWEAWLTLAAPCCDALTYCMQVGCIEALGNYSECVENCHAVHDECMEGIEIDYEECDEFPGDCPLCFGEDVILSPPPLQPGCSVSQDMIDTCEPPDEFGMCFGGDTPCSEDTACGVGCWCVGSAPVDPGKEYHACPWFAECVLFTDGRGEEDLEPGEILCTTPFPIPPPIRPCTITVGTAGLYDIESP